MKTLPLIFITLVLAAGLFSGPEPAYAAECSPAQLEAGCLTDEQEAAVAAAEQKKLNELAPGCSIIFNGVWECTFALIGNGLLTLGAYFVALAGLLLDNAVKFSLNIASFVNANPGITEAWKVIRDFGNIAFIFVLLWIAIQTILGLGDSKKLLVSVITAALLINFSLFFVKAIIDVSNVVAYQFYSAMTKGVDTNGTFGNGISARFMQELDLQSLYAHRSGEAAAIVASGKLSLWDIALVSIFGFVFLVITGFIFLQAAIFFIARTIALMVIMVFSPLYFIGMLVPKINEYVKDGMNKLIEQSLVAPVYLMFLFVILKIMEKAGQGGVIGSTPTGASFAAALTSQGGHIGIVVNFIAIIGLMLTALSVTKKLSGGAGAMGMKFFSNTAGLALGLASGGTALLGRQTIGRAAALFTKSERLKEAASKDTGMGRFLNSTLRRADTLSKSSFDARNAEPSKLPVIGKGIGLGGKALGGIVKTAGVGIGIDAGKPGVAAGKGFAVQREQEIKAQVKMREDTAKLLEMNETSLEEKRREGKFNTEKAAYAQKYGAEEAEKKFGKFKKAKAINAERRAAYAQSLKTTGFEAFATRVPISLKYHRRADVMAADKLEKGAKGAKSQLRLEAAIRAKEDALKQALGIKTAEGEDFDDEAVEREIKKKTREYEKAAIEAEELAKEELDRDKRVPYLLAKRDALEQVEELEKLVASKEKLKGELQKMRDKDDEASKKEGGEKTEGKKEDKKDKE